MSDSEKKDIKISAIKNKIKLSKKAKIAIISCCSVLFVLILCFGIITCINKLNSKVFKNVYMLGENYSGKTSEEVIQIINSKSNELNSSERLDIYQNGENIYNVKAEDIDFKFDVEKTAQSIMSFGRDSNLFKNNFNMIKALFSKKVIEPIYAYDNEKFENVIKNIDLSIKDRYVDDSYSLDEKNGKLIIVNGKTGNAINYEYEKENILKAFENKEENTCR